MQAPNNWTNWQPPSWPHDQHGHGPPGYDPQTMLRMQVTYMEVRLDKHETRLHELERPRSSPSPLSVLKDWAPVILPLLIMLGVLLGKFTWPEAAGLLRGG